MVDHPHSGSNMGAAHENYYKFVNRFQSVTGTTDCNFNTGGSSRAHGIRRTDQGERAPGNPRNSLTTGTNQNDHQERTSAKSEDDNRIVVLQILGALSSVVLFAGVFFPWYEINPSHGDAGATFGIIGTEYFAATIILFLAIIAFIGLLTQNPLAHVISSFGGLIALVLAFAHVQNHLFLEEYNTVDYFFSIDAVTPGIGLLVCLFAGGAVFLLGGIVTLVELR